MFGYAERTESLVFGAHKSIEPTCTVRAAIDRSNSLSIADTKNIDDLATFEVVCL